MDERPLHDAPDPPFTFRQGADLGVELMGVVDKACPVGAGHRRGDGERVEVVRVDDVKALCPEQAVCAYVVVHEHQGLVHSHQRVP